MKKHYIAVLFLSILILTFSIACSETASLRNLTADTSASELDLGALNVHMSELIRFLDQFTNLHKCDMYSIPVTAAQIRTLVERYPEVEFGWTIRIGDHTVRTDQTAFSTLHEGGEENLHNATDFSVLKYCKQLQALDIGHNGVRDLSFLYDLPNLKVLILACNRIVDITPIASLKNLEYLELFSNRINDLTPLTSLHHLMDLNIGYNSVTDYEPLQKMTWLQRLWIGKASVYAPGNEPQAEMLVA